MLPSQLAQFVCWTLCSYEELTYAKRNHKSIYPVRVVPLVEEEAVEGLLGNLQGSSWSFTEHVDPPEKLITDVIRLLQKQTEP